MRVLVCGLGDIARKAYLPVLVARPDIELHLATRDPAVLAAVGAEYRIAARHTGVMGALATTRFDAAFVHSATAVHPAMVEMLLDRGVAVFVDKPLADTLAEATRLVALAETRNLLLAVGFNRRFAPDYTALRQAPRPFVLLQKHRRAHPDTARRVVFDDFIHVVDTLRFLAPGPTPRVGIETIVRDGLLHGVTLTLAGEGHQLIGTMQRDSGLDEERLDVIGAAHKVSVVNLSDRFEHDGAETRHRRGDWIPVARQRGFEAMCADFLAGVRGGRRTAGDDILDTHRLCEAIVTQTEAIR